LVSATLGIVYSASMVCSMFLPSFAIWLSHLPA
jgi:hypothetical protein